MMFINGTGKMGFLGGSFYAYSREQRERVSVPPVAWFVGCWRMFGVGLCSIFRAVQSYRVDWWCVLLLSYLTIRILMAMGLDFPGVDGGSGGVGWRARQITTRGLLLVGKSVCWGHGENTFTKDALLE